MVQDHWSVGSEPQIVKSLGYSWTQSHGGVSAVGRGWRRCPNRYEDSGSHCSYRPESNFGTSDTVLRGPTQSRVTPRAAAPTLTYSRATSREGVLSTHDKP